MGIQEIGFGDFCTIEQKRYVGPNEFYGYKVVGRKKSNVWTDVPVDANNGKETRHDYMDDVVTVVCNNLDDRTVYQFRVSDLASVKKAQGVPEWIETAIQPPEEGQKVIISGIYGVGIAEFSYLYKDEFVMYDMGASNPILSKDQVKFWQPLPDAPQEPAND